MVRPKSLSALVVAVLCVTLLVWPGSASAAGTLKTSALALYAKIGLAGSLVTLTADEPGRQSWADGGTGQSDKTAEVKLQTPLLGQEVLYTGAVTSTATPSTSGGGRAESTVAGVRLLGANGITAGAIRTACLMNPSGVTTTVEIADLKLGGQTIANPAVNLATSVLGLADVVLNERTATWNQTTGLYDYTVRALDVKLLNNALGLVANGEVVVAESKCQGTIKLGAIAVDGVSLAPGQSGTPAVTVTNTGEVGAPNTTITIPLPPAAYDLGTPTVTGGGTCTTNATSVVCTGVTVPGGGSAKVSLPVQLKASAPTGAAAWSPGAGTIVASSTPVTGASDAMEIKSTGTLVTTQARRSTGGSFAVTPTTLYAGKSATTGVKLTNDGPSDALTSITIPIGNRPAGVTVDKAVVGGKDCTIDDATITCTGVTVPGGGSVTVNVTASAPSTQPVGVTWDLANLAATLNSTPVTGQGRLLTIGDPDVNLDGGVTIAPATAIPGGASATATVRVANTGAAAAAGSTAATITLPAPPAGYTVGQVTTTGGGTCTAAVAGITCTGVTIPARGAVTVSMPVTLAANVTADWTAAAGAPVRAVAGDSTGTAVGRIVAASPRYTLGVTANGPADDTVSPGQSTTITADVYNQGPSDGKQAKFVVIAPKDTTFGTLTGTAAAICTPNQPVGATTLHCTTDIAAGGAALRLALPVTVSPLADPATPVTGGCVSLDNDTTCSGPDDAALPTIKLRTALATRLSATFTPATITPGATGTGTIGLRSTRTESGVAVSIPITDLPAGFTLGTVTVPGGSCQTGATAITCSGIPLTANATTTVSVPVRVAGTVTPPLAWVPANVTVTAGNEQLTTTGALAGTGTVSYSLQATTGVPAAGTVEPGGGTTLTMNVTNTGVSTATNAAFSVIAPTGATFDSPLPPAVAALCQRTTGTLLSCRATLNGSESTGPISVPVTIAANADPDRPITGGCVDQDGIPGCGPADKAFDPITLKAPLSARVAITADRADVVPGGTATATLHVKAARDDLTGITLTIPKTALATTAMTVTGVHGPAGGGCTPSAGQITCTSLTIRAGETADIELTMAAPSSAPAGQTWTAANITVADGGTPVTVAAQELARTIAAKPTLAANAVINLAQALPGGQGTLQATLTNSGPSDATNTPITIVAPAGATFDTPLTGNAATACTVVLPGRTTATCRITLAAGAAPLQLDLPITIGQNVVPDRAITGGCVDLDNSGTCTVAADELIPAVTVGAPLQQRLAVTSVPAQIAPGETGNATLSLRSTKAESNLSVSIKTDDLPAGSQVTAATKPGGGACTGVGTATITCAGVNLAANTTGAITLTVKAPSSATPATWTAAGITATAGAETATAINDLAVIGLPKVALTATGGAAPAADTVLPGQTATFTATVTNAAPSDANPATFTVLAPTGTTFAAPLPGICTRTADTLLTCSRALTAGADTGPLNFVVQIPANADPFQPVTGGCVNLDGVSGCGADDLKFTALTLRVPFERAIAVASTPVTVTPGRADDATITLSAEGASLTGVTVTVPAPPAGFGVTTATPGCLGTGPITCTNLTVPSGAPLAITLRVTVDPDVTPGTTWNAAPLTLVRGAETITPTRRLAVAGAVDVDLAAGVPTVTPTQIEPGKTGAVAVTLTNNGDSDATAVPIGIIPPAGTKITGTLPAGCLAVPDTNRVTCPITLAAGGTLPVGVELTVDPAATPGQTLGGGCVDLNNDGICGAGDRALAAITVDPPFDREVTVRTTAATIAPSGTGTGSASVVVTAAAGQPGLLSVRIPIDRKPATMTLTPAPGATNGGTCTVDNAAKMIICDDVDLSAPGSATVTIPVSVAGATAGDVWSTSGVQVRNADGETVGGGGFLVVVGTPQYTLGVPGIAAPPADTVLPGGTGTVTVTVRNTGVGPATGVPITLRASTGTSFGTPLPAGCTAAAATTLTCDLTLAAGASADLAVPLVLSTTAPATISGGCVDLNNDGTCSGEPTFPSFARRSPLTAILTSAPTTAPAITPGRTGTVTIPLTSTLGRDDVTFTVGAAGRPAGLTVTAADVDGVTCPITDGVVTCADVDLAANVAAKLKLTMKADPAAAQGGSWTAQITAAQGVADTALLAAVAATIDAPSTGSGLATKVTAPAAGTLLPGGAGRVLVDLTNPGPSAMPGATVTVRAPDGVTFGTLDGLATDHCVRVSSIVVTCTIDLGVETRQFRLPVQVAATATPGATVAGGCVDTDRDGVCENGEPAIAFVLGKPFSAQAVLSLDGGMVTPGGFGTGVVRIDADRALAGMSATIPYDDLPAGLTVTGVAGPTGSTCTWTGRITCTGLTAPQAVTPLISVTVKAAADLPAGVAWTPRPVTVTDANGNASVTTGVLVTTGSPAPGLTFTPTQPTGTFAAGSTAPITLTVANTGTSNATNVLSRITAPAGTTFGALAPDIAPYCTPVGAPVGATQLDCKVTMAAGAAPVTWTLGVRIPANADPDTPLTGGCVDVDRNGSCGAGDTALPVLRVTPALSRAVTVTATETEITPGETGTIAIRLASTPGRDDVTVSIPTTSLPAGMRITHAQVPGGDCTVAADAVTCTGIDIAAGGSQTITLNAEVAATAPSGSWTPTVTVSQGGESVGTTLPTARVGAPDVDVDIEVTAPAPGTVKPGSTGTMTATVINTGSSTARDVKYTFVAPAGTTFQPPTGTTATVCTLTPGGARMDCTVDVNGNARTQIPLVFQVPPSADPRTPLTGGCVDTGADGVCTEGVDPTLPPVQLALPMRDNVQIVGVPVTVAPGASGTASVRVTAVGPVTGATVTVPLTGLPAGVTVTGQAGSAGATCTRSAAQVQCTGVNLVTGGNTPMTLTFAVDAAATPGGPWISPAVTVTAGGETATGTAALLTVGARDTAVTWTVTGGGGAVTPGGTTTLTVTGRNTGASDATGRTVAVVAPAHTTFGPLAGPAAENCTVTSPRLLTCTADIPAGGNLTWSVPLVVDSTAGEGDQLTGGCLSTDGDTACDGDKDVAIGVPPVDRPLRDNGMLTLNTAVIAAGESGDATITLAAGTAYTGLTLTVPLAGLPDALTVRGASLDGATCTVGGTAITCTGVDLTAGTARTLRMAVAVAGNAPATTVWRASGVTLVDPKDPDDRLTAAGLLVSASNSAYTVSVTVGSPSVPAPVQGATTVVPITLTNAGPGAASPYPVSIRLPAGTTLGDPPAGCSVASPGVVTCSVSLPAGASTRINLPLVVDLDAEPESTVTGGCLDQALSAGAPEFDQACGGDADVAVPDFTVGRHAVNLHIEYDKPAIVIDEDAQPVVKLPYANEGTEVADNVQFTVAPPAGVVVLAAQVVLGDTGSSNEDDTATASAQDEDAGTADAEETVAAPCDAAGDGAAANAVVCAGPDSAGLGGSELWLTLDALDVTETGTRPMSVNISTTSEDGNSSDNTVQVWLKLMAASNTDDGGDGDKDDDGTDDDGDLPVTGAQVTGAVLLALVLLAGGGLALLLTAPLAPVAAPGTLRWWYRPRHARPLPGFSSRPLARRRRRRQAG